MKEMEGKRGEMKEIGEGKNEGKRNKHLIELASSNPS